MYNCSGGKRQDVPESVQNARLVPDCDSHVSIAEAIMNMKDHRGVTECW